MSDGEPPEPAYFQPAFFDPLSTDQLTKIICRQFEEQPPVPLASEPPPFDGPGLYAIYYRSTSEALYAPLRHLPIPVYVGQAASHNSATGRTSGARRPLHQRIRQHRLSIHGGGLSVDEFSVRLLAMPDVHIDMGENGLRVGYKPVWNSVLTGFGSHEQGSSTRRSSRSKWDTVHRGRSRTFGDSRWDRDTLATEAARTIDGQVATFDELPWHHATL